MENCKKYERQYFMPPKFEYDWVKKDYVDAPPIWCSVDLRDGNQALIEPMSLDEAGILPVIGRCGIQRDRSRIPGSI